MRTTELNTMDEIRMISDEDLGAVAGGFQTYHGGGGGKEPFNGFQQGDPGLVLDGWGIVTVAAFVLF